MSYGCPRCGSENTQKITSVVTSGTTEVETTKLTTGLLGGANGIGAGYADHKLRSLSQTELAAKFAEPKQEYCGFFWYFLYDLFFSGIAFFVVAALAWFAGANPTTPYAFTGFFVYLFIRMRRSRKTRAAIRDYNQNTYPTEHAFWSKGFYCHRCEHTYVPTVK